MTNDHNTRLALLDQRQDSLEKDIRKTEERLKSDIDDHKVSTDGRFKVLERGIVLTLISFAAWFGKIIAGKIGL